MKTETTKQQKTIGVVTLYKAFNHGAFLQAYALQKFLKQQGFSVCFINVYDSKHDLLTLKTLKPSKKNIFKSTYFNLRKLFTFKSAQKIFHTADRQGYLDAAILGSDEIWNVKNPTFMSAPEFFGLNINTNLLISYAPSAAQSTGKDIIKQSELVDGIKNIDFCSARDENALDIIKKSTGKDGLRVLDPTFLTEIEDEYLDIGYEKFIVVYSYGVTPGVRENVRAFASNKGLPVISLGFYADWCDKSVNANPFQFMNALKRAEFVITDTFHGTVLSVQLRKNVAIYADGKEKIEDFLNAYRLSHRAVRPDNDLDQVLGTGIREADCADIDNKLIISKAFLISALSSLSTKAE